MPNTFLKPQTIAATALGLLQRDIVLPGLVWTDAVADFAGKFGDTVTVRIPAQTASRKRNLRATGSGRNVTMDSLTETGIDVKLDTDVYNAIPVTDEELTLDISDFGAQILAPQTRAIAEGLENELAACMAGASYATSVELDPAGMYNGAVDVRQALNDANVPKGARAIVVGSAIEAAFLKDPQFVRADQSGSDQALREALIGRVAGFDVYQSNAIATDAGYAFHRTAFIMATRAPRVPDGASFGQSTSYAGLAMRWLRDYDFTSTTDRSLVDTYCGFKAVNDGASSKVVRAVKLTLKAPAAG
ncbi:MAG TPA: P22 phage major capsid protein family protein [Jatrophihabitans sp.]|nr:P22 phage major capsid protein family protein [Jatrophihabitans sp.]